jgi:hypothetical protein
LISDSIDLLGGDFPAGGKTPGPFNQDPYAEACGLGEIQAFNNTIFNHQCFGAVVDDPDICVFCPSGVCQI